MEPGNIVAKDHTPLTLLVWLRKHRYAECGAERYMAGIFPLTKWQISDGSMVSVDKDCEGRGDNPRPLDYLSVAETSISC